MTSGWNIAGRGHNQGNVLRQLQGVQEQRQDHGRGRGESRDHFVRCSGRIVSGEVTGALDVIWFKFGFKKIFFNCGKRHVT